MKIAVVIDKFHFLQTEHEIKLLKIQLYKLGDSNNENTALYL